MGSLHLPPQTPPGFVENLKILGTFSPALIFIFLMLSLSHLCSSNRAPPSYISCSSCCFFPHERMGGAPGNDFFLWLMWLKQTSNPHVSALPDPLVQLLSHSSKKPTWKAVNLVFLENMVLREDVGDLKCLRVCKDKEQIKKKQKQTI